MACKELGIHTVACIRKRTVTARMCVTRPGHLHRPAKSARSYLDVSAIISAPKSPTWTPSIRLRFSERERRVCRSLRDVGHPVHRPQPRVIRLMGVKEQARAFMREMGVPVLPGSPGVLASPEEALLLAEQIGYPVILKASAGAADAACAS